MNAQLKKSNSRALLFVLFVFSTLMIKICQAQDNPQLDLRARQLFSQIMSPYCPGRLLDDCPSGEAIKLREDIRQRLNAGQDEESIMQNLRSVYGSKVQAAPSIEGFGAVAWYAVPAFILLGLLLVVVWLRASMVKSN